jgi:hypothetical protein
MHARSWVATVHSLTRLFCRNRVNRLISETLMYCQVRILTEQWKVILTSFLCELNRLRIFDGCLTSDMPFFLNELSRFLQDVPLMAWTSTCLYFISMESYSGSPYTPQPQCSELSQRLPASYSLHNFHTYIFGLTSLTFLPKYAIPLQWAVHLKAEYPFTTTCKNIYKF